MTHIKQVSIDGNQIQRIVFDRLMPALEGEAFEPSVMSLMTLTVLMMRPDMPIEQLQGVVMSLSEYLMLSMTDEGTVN